MEDYNGHTKLVFALLTILISFIISLSIWSRKKVKYKVLSITIGVFAYFISYATLLEILSRPKPKNLELLNKHNEDIEVKKRIILFKEELELWKKENNIN